MKKQIDETQKNLETLKEIRDDPMTSPAVRIQAIQTMQKILDGIGATAQPDKITEEDIMKKIRGAK